MVTGGIYICMDLSKALRNHWVQAQLVLLAAAAAAGPIIPRLRDRSALGSVLTSVDPWALRAVGSLLCVAGVAFAAWAARILGAALTPEPEPLPDAVLVQRGPYGVVRHPIYTGVVLAGLGWTWAWSNWALALVVGLALALFLEAKAQAEERMLQARFPEYRPYRDRVRWRVVRPDPARPHRLP